jgi:hypothetical protein
MQDDKHKVTLTECEVPIGVRYEDLEKVFQQIESEEFFLWAKNKGIEVYMSMSHMNGQQGTLLSWYSYLTEKQMTFAQLKFKQNN